MRGAASLAKRDNGNEQQQVVDTSKEWPKLHLAIHLINNHDVHIVQFSVGFTLQQWSHIELRVQFTRTLCYEGRLYSI